MLQPDMRDDARSMLGQVVEKYPKSAAAARARKLLAEMTGKHPAPAGSRKSATTKKK